MLLSSYSNPETAHFNLVVGSVTNSQKEKEEGKKASGTSHIAAETVDMLQVLRKERAE